MLIDTDLLTVCDIPADVTADLIKELNKLDWDSLEFARAEAALATARVIELPFVERGVNNTSITHAYIAEQARGIFDIVKINYPDCVFFRGEIAALRPGISATLHKDRRWFHEHSHRLHVPLITNDQCMNFFAGREYHLNVNTLYEINNRIPHGAYNKGTSTRIHCIMDLMPRVHYERMLAESINKGMFTCEP